MYLKLKSHILFMVFVHILFLNGLDAQNVRNKARRDKKNLEFYNTIVSVEDDAFKQITSPEKWNNESYVFLGIHSYITLHNPKKIPENGNRGFERKRVVLQDKSAVELFSEFYFDDAETVVIYLIKKDGREEEVDLRNAIKVETKGSTVYASRFYSSKRYKMAIPGLEIGDVLDYTTIFSQYDEIKPTYIGYLNATVPIVYQNISIDYKNNSNVFYNTFNTPYKAEMVSGGGFDITGKNNEDTNRLQIISGDLEARKETPWQNDFDVEPLYKIHIIASNCFYHEDGLPADSTINTDRLYRNKIREASRIYSEYIDIEATYSYVFHFRKKSKLNVEQTVQLLYYRLRKVLTQYQYPQAGIEQIKYYKKTYDDIFTYSGELPEFFFIHAFKTSLKLLKIDYEMVLMTPNNFGKPENLVSDEEFYVGFYIPEIKEYFWVPNRDRTHKDKPYALLRGGYGTGALGSTIKTKEVVYNNHKIETSAVDDNYVKTKMDIEILEDDLLKINQNTTYAGYLKDYHSELQEQFGGQLYDDFLSIFEDPFLLKEKKGFETCMKLNKDGLYVDFSERSHKNRVKNIEELLKEGDRTVTLLSHSVPSSGRTPNNPNLIFNAEFTVDGYYQPLGKNILLEPGKLIGEQRYIEEKHRTNRESDIFFDVPRKYSYEINIRIPEGYSIEDVSKLNKSVQNEYCSFESKASLNDGILHITTEKAYKALQAPRSAWNDILLVMDTAYHFTQEKVILKKK